MEELELDSLFLMFFRAGIMLVNSKQSEKLITIARILRHPISEGKTEIRKSSFFAKNEAI